MRTFGRFVVFVCIAAYTLVTAQSPRPDAAARVLAAAREALGCENKLMAVKTILTTGRMRQVRGENLVPIEFEIAVELPDKYVRKDEIPAQESDPTTVGFNGEELVQFPVPTMPSMPPRPGAPPAPTTGQLEAAPGQPSPPPLPPAAPAARGAPTGAPTPPVETRLYYGDYRDASGVQFPFRLRRAVGPDTVEETTFDGFKINGKIDSKKFEART